jgi:ElaB/YqjD/DUF883 family membrane-anchored ribosome-binding protein
MSSIPEDNRSADEIENDIERTRAEVSSTIDAIQSKLTPGELMDQAIQYLRNSGGGDFGRNLGRTVRDNPVPVALIGVGIAWLAMGGTRRRTDLSPWDDAPAIRDRDASGRWSEGYEAGRWRDHTPGSTDDMGVDADWRADDLDEPGLGSRVRQAGSDAGQRARGVMSSAASSVSDAASRVSETVSDVASRAKDTVSSAADRAREAAHRAGSRMGGVREGVRYRTGALQGRTRQQMYRARATTTRLADEQPLLIAAVGVAIGAAIGAALPSTRREDELMGEFSDDLMHGATDTVREQMGTVAESAQRVAQKARDEIGRAVESVAGSDPSDSSASSGSSTSSGSSASGTPASGTSGTGASGIGTGGPGSSGTGLTGSSMTSAGTSGTGGSPRGASTP